jgi:hypothetical protein
MSTPSATPGTPSTPGTGVSAAAKAGVTAAAEVTKKKNSLRYSPKKLEASDPLTAQGHAYAVIEVASGAAVKGFADEASAQEACEELNAQ